MNFQFSIFSFQFVRRWWQGMGFGIQSKTDYEYLHDVLKESHPYYAYAELPDKWSQLIYRVCLHARKGKIAIIGHFTDTELKAATLATHGLAEHITDLKSTYLYDTIITKDLSILSSPPYVTGGARGGSINWDIQGHLGIIQRIPDRYPEHYRI